MQVTLETISEMIKEVGIISSLSHTGALLPY